MKQIKITRDNQELKIFKNFHSEDSGFVICLISNVIKSSESMFLTKKQMQNLVTKLSSELKKGEK